MNGVSWIEMASKVTVEMNYRAGFQWTTNTLLDVRTTLYEKIY